MSDELRRLLDQHEDLGVTRVLSAGLDDEPSHDSFLRAAWALGAGAALVATAGATASVASKPAALGAGGSLTLAFAKWFGVGLLMGGVATSPLILEHEQRAEAPRRAEAARAAAPAAVALPATVRSPEPIEPKPEVAPAAKPERPSRGALPATPAGPPAGAGPSSARFDVPAPSALEAEVASLDAARRALRSGNANGALEQLARYESTPDRKLSAEATLLRVQALVMSGRSAEAQQIALSVRRARGDDGYACRVVKLAGLAAGACPDSSP